MCRLLVASLLVRSVPVRMLLLAGMAAAACGCGRTPPTPARQASAADRAAGETATSAAKDGERVVRDERVEPAAFVVPVRPPPSEQSLAAEALSRIGPPAVPLLVEALRSSDLETRRQACEVLLRMGPDAKEAVPDLVRLLEDDEEELRKMAAKALGRIGPDAAPAVPALMRALFEGDPPLAESAEAASYSR